MVRWLLVGGEVLVVHAESFQESAQFQLREDHSDTTDNAGLVCHDMVACREYYVATRCCDVAGKSVQLEVMLAGKVLHLFADDLALHWQSAWRVHNYC